MIFFEAMEWRLRAAGKLGEVLLEDIQLPCFSAETLESDLWSMVLLDELELVKEPLVKVPIMWNTIIGLWYLWAAIAELGEEWEENANQLKEIRSPVIKAIYEILQARKQEINPDEALQSLKDFNIPKNALEFVKRWITGQVSFVASLKMTSPLRKARNR